MFRVLVAKAVDGYVVYKPIDAHESKAGTHQCRHQLRLQAGPLRVHLAIVGATKPQAESFRRVDPPAGPGV